MLNIHRFDDKTNNLLTQWREDAFNSQDKLYEDAAVWPPHITIAAYEDMNINDLCNWTCEYTKNLL